MAFDAEKVKNDIVLWIREWFEENGKGCKAVIGLSGGKDSSVVAALCTEALGKDRVFGVMMPNGEQFDIDVSRALVKHLGIEAVEFNIKGAYDGVVEELMRHLIDTCAAYDIICDKKEILAYRRQYSNQTEGTQLTFDF